MPRADLTGQRFGRLAVSALYGSDKNGNAKWVCRCDCGNERIVYAQSLKAAATTSCGCFAKEVVSAANIKHGMSGTNEYKAWHMMVQRCTNPKNHKWARYGGRGITVCERWLSFENFREDMGPRTPGLTVDRRDNDGNYEPGNCRWATPMEQGNNRGNHRHVQVGGERLTATQASRRLGPNKHTVSRRLRDGWTVERAVSQPLNHKEGSNAND